MRSADRKGSANQPPHLTAAALLVILVPPAPVAAAGEPGAMRREEDGKSTEVVMAKGDCKVDMRNEKGELVAELTIKNGKKVAIGGNTTLHCKNGNVTVTETNPTKRGVVKHPVLVVGTEGPRLARKRRKP